MSGFVVPLFAFRQALQAVKVHAGTGKDDPGLAVVGLLPGEVVHVLATDRYTAAVATVPISLHEDDDADRIDLAVEDVDKVLAVFKMPADKEQWGQAEVHVYRHGDEVTFTDAGGLFEGQALTVPVFDNPGLPDVRSLIASALRAPDYRDGADLGVGQRHASKIVTASKTYTYPAYAQLRGRTKPQYLVLVGPDFAAVVQPVVPTTDDEHADESHEEDSPQVWRRAWRRALEGVGRGEDSLEGWVRTLTDAGVTAISAIRAEDGGGDL